MKSTLPDIGHPGPFRPARVTDQIANWLRNKILSGETAAGTHLPPERLLAQHLDVTRNTIRSALARLQAEELLELRHGSGAVVRDFKKSAGLALSVHLLSLGREQEIEILQGMLVIRRGLAAEAVAMAALRITNEQVERLQELADQLNKENDRAAFIRLDAEFTRAVIRASGNLPMELMYNDIIRVTDSRPDINQLRFLDLDRIRSYYRHTVDLIQEGDPDRARDEIRRLLEAADEWALNRILPK